jgi:hypothetical protein
MSPQSRKSLSGNASVGLASAPVASLQVRPPSSDRQIPTVVNRSTLPTIAYATVDAGGAPRPIPTSIRPVPTAAGSAASAQLTPSAETQTGSSRC